ncbi:MAG: HEAT repeat domain-containing protein [Planctomycetes bacterium]|nr:HEAT repeat domain-containing protein [Planctomycetota bacterium]
MFTRLKLLRYARKLQAPGRASLEAIRALAKIGTAKAISTLIDGLPREHIDESVVDKALDRLEESSERASLVTDLRIRLNAKRLFDCRTSSKAAEALVKIGTPEAASAIISTLKDTPTIEVIRVLGQIGDRRAVAPLLDLLKQRESLLSGVAEALGQLGDVRAIPPLVDNLLATGNRSAARALVALGWQPANLREHVALAVATGNTGQVVPAGADAVIPVLARHKQLEDAHAYDGEEPRPYSAAESVAKEVIREIGDEAFHKLMELLQESSSELTDLKPLAARMLAKAAGPRSLESLIAAYETSEDWEVLLRQQILFAFQDLKDRRAVPLLMNELEKPKERRDRSAIALVLEEIGDPRAEPSLIRVLEDTGQYRGDDAIACDVATALVTCGGAESLQPLVRCVHRVCKFSIAGHYGSFSLKEAKEILTAIASRCGGEPLLPFLSDDSLPSWLVAMLYEIVLGLGLSVEEVASPQEQRKEMRGTIKGGQLSPQTHVRSLRDIRLVHGYSGGAVYAVAFAPDGSSILSAEKADGNAQSRDESDTHVILWDLSSGERVWMGRHRVWFDCLAVSPDGRRGLSGGTDGTIHVWDLLRLGRGLVLNAHPGHVKCVAISHDGQRALSGGDHNDIRAKHWDLATGKCLNEFQFRVGGINAVAFALDGRAALVADHSGLTLLDLATGECLREFCKKEECVDRLALAPDGQHILSGSYSQGFKIWEVSTGEQLASTEPVGHLNCVTMSPDGRHAICSTGGITGGASCFLLDIFTGQRLMNLDVPQEVATHSISISPDGQHVLTGSAGGARLWHLE